MTTRLFHPTEDMPETIEILVLADTFSLNTIICVLKQADYLQFNLRQATNLTIDQDILVSIDLVLYDANFKGISLEKTITFFWQNNLQIPVLVVNGKSHIPTAVAAIKTGAVDYLTSETLSHLPQIIIKTLSQPDYFYFQSLCEAKSDRQLQKLILENPDGIIVVDERGIVKFVNAAALKLLNKSFSDELMGEALGFPVVNGDYLEVDIPVGKDKTLVAQMRVSQIQWQGIKAYVVSLRDITQLKQAEEERVKLLDEAQAANRAKDEFLAILSHELRTPLNPIVGWAQLLIKGSLPEVQLKQGAEIIYRNAMLQSQLIGDILDISRIIQGKLKLQICSVNLVNIINNALETVNLIAQDKSIQIKTNLAQIGLVKGDPTRIQQVVWNLLTNAIKFTPEGGIVEVKLDSKKDKLTNYAQIQVIDSGKGITSEFLPYVFDYFRQAETTKTRSEGGLGLGLAIVRRLIKLHEGDITATSQGLGKGATFTIFLPIFADTAKNAQEQSLQQINNLSGNKVLVVDDNNDSRHLICFLLEAEGAEVNAVSSAVEALSQIDRFEPNILISDIGMPLMNGYELISKIRRQQFNSDKKLKAIALSGYASEQDRQRSLEAGFDHHLNKPLNISYLMKILKM